MGIVEPSARLLRPVARSVWDLTGLPNDGELHHPGLGPLGHWAEPKASVVIPCHNDARYLGLALESILGQTFQHWEAIVVDDGSTDDTRQVVGTYQDPRIRYIYQENRGLPAAWNAGTAAAGGRYIARLDADDLALPHRLASQIDMLEAHPELSVVGSGYVFMDEQGQRIASRSYSWQPYPNLNDLRTWLFNCPFMPSATMFRRSAWEELGGADESLVSTDDWNFWMRLVLAGHRMAWHRDVVCLYRLRASSLSRRAETVYRDSLEALNRILEHPDFPPHLRQAGIQALALRHLDGAKRLYRAGLWEAGKEALETALSQDPDLMAGQPPRVEDELLDAALGPLDTDPMGFLRASFAHLPENAGPLLDRKHHMLTRCHLELLAQGVLQGDLRIIAQHLLPTLLAQPRWLSGRAAWAYLARAVANRARRVASYRRRSAL
jgi:glycosyltransferase involved in cell wall biosynthesis